MQTFLPYESFQQTAEILDYKRLGKQRLETKQILNALAPGSTSKWRNHPAVKMWKGYEECLKLYMSVMIKEWISRGYKNTMEIPEINGDRNGIPYPPWLGDERLHLSHRCNLYRKNPDYYCKYFGMMEREMRKAPYWWPVPLKNKKMNEEMNIFWSNYVQRFDRKGEKRI